LQSAIGKRYAAQFPNKPYLTNARLDEPTVAPTPYTGAGKRNTYLNDSNKAYLSCQHIKSYVSSLSDSSLTDFLFVTITPYRKDLDLQEAEVIDQTEDNQEVEEAVESLHAVPIAGKSIRAFLDTGCLVGDGISKSIVDSLNASHLLFNVSTTICSGFNNQWQNKFQALKINLSFTNEITSSLEHIITTVIVVKDSPIDLIIGRETIKKLRLIDSLPSHFVESTNLNVLQNTQESFANNSSKTRKVSFVDDYPEELFGYSPKNQVRTERDCPVKAHAYTCLSCLNLDDEAVDSYGPTVNNKAAGEDRIKNTLLCLCNKASSYGSCLGRPDQLLPRHLSKGGQMLTTVTEEENENHLLLGATIQQPSREEYLAESAHPLPYRNQQKKWLLQESGLYIPVLSEKSGSPFVSSMTHLSSDKLERRVSKTWGANATAIKRQEQLDDSQYRTTDNSPVAMGNTLSAITPGDDTTLSRFNTAEQDNESSDTLDTKHDVFDDFKSKGDDPDIDILDTIHIEGSPALRVRIRTLLEKFRSVFATHLPSEPALIPPFELNVDKERWEQPSNRGPPRVQSPAKQEEIRLQLERTKVIEPSTASYYSQVILASKPNDKWRFCIDYRKLNDCTQSASWPIPDIGQMFGRLGRHHFNLFGVMDLTAGYHQAPVSLGTRVFLAFIYFCGIFQFCRLPFGPKRAPSYFQHMMTSVVLVGLIYFICEMYFDDCIVHAVGDDQFLERLEKVLAQLNKHLITLKPSKCKFGMSMVEYCGKQIDQSGLSMSKKKIQRVLDFPKPKTAHQMKQFIGLANYFHDHVPHHSDIIRALHNMITGYKKKTRAKALVWTEEGTLAFFQIIKEIEKNHTRDDCPIFLQTDSSDYGIGAYYFQLVDNAEQPVAFVSKSLNSTQFKLAIIQKEAYAIFYALRNLRAILRDRRFTLQTDNRGLRFMRTDSNPMVYR
jgi:hypothetical protein